MSKKLLLSLLLTFLIFSNNTLIADEKSHYEVARQLVEVTFNKKTYENNFRRGYLLAIKDSYKNNPKTAPYSDLLLNIITEVLEAYLNDPETPKKVKEITSKIYMEEFTKDELQELLTFYRTKVGQKVLLKEPVLIEKQWQRESQLKLPPKYESIINEKVKKLQKEGKLPGKFE